MTYESMNSVRQRAYSKGRWQQCFVLPELPQLINNYWIPQLSTNMKNLKKFCRFPRFTGREMEGVFNRTMTLRSKMDRVFIIFGKSPHLGINNDIFRKGSPFLLRRDSDIVAHHGKVIRIFYGRTTILIVPCTQASLRISPEHWTKLKPRSLPYFLTNTPTFFADTSVMTVTFYMLTKYYSLTH